MTLKERAEMISYYGRTHQFIKLNIPFSVWAVFALAIGVFFALMIVLGSFDI
jgi:hypothetical protein